MVLSLSHLQRYHERQYGFMWQIVTGDETLCCHFEPESKSQSKQWKRAPRNQTTSKEIKGCSHQFWQGHVMPFFFDHKGLLLVEFLERGITINAPRYQATLQRVQDWILPQPTSFFKDGVDQLGSQLDKCANSFDDYF
ncbi:mariner Mos1 transposase [Trichonephila clavipes]|nr:mariner Mos1 transposase [Trichonephila clavipes]